MVGGADRCEVARVDLKLCKPVYMPIVALCNDPDKATLFHCVWTLLCFHGCTSLMLKSLKLWEGGHFSKGKGHV